MWEHMMVVQQEVPAVWCWLLDIWCQVELFADCEHLRGACLLGSLMLGLELVAFYENEKLLTDDFEL
jgi:hypothetical protein